MSHINQSLLESEKRMNLSQEIAHLGGWELDIENDSLSWSAEVYRIFGLQPQEFDATYEAFLDNVHPDDREEVDEAYSGSIREGRDTYEIEHRIIRKSTGEVRIVHEKCEHFRDSSNRIVRSIGMVHDITEQKRTEEALRESEKRLHALADNIPNLAWMAEADGWIFWYNKRWYEYTGTTLEEMQGWGWQKVHHPDYIDAITAEWSSSILEGKPYDNIFPLKGKDGNYRWFLTRVTPIRDEQGKLIRWFGTNTDITERKLAEEELKISEDKYHSLYSSMSEGVAIHEIIYNSEHNPVDYVIVDINPSYEKITGLKKSDAVGMKASELYGTSKPPYMEYYALVAENGEPIEFETYFEPMNKYFKISVISPGKGKFATIFEDITKRKLADIEINEVKENLELMVQKRTQELKFANRYNRSLIEASLDPLVTIGPDGKITDVNHSTEVVTGFNRYELIGTDFSDYFTEPQKAREGYQKVFNEGFVLDYLLEIKNKNGYVTPVLYNASVYKDEFGEVIGVFAAARDITEIRKFEKDLKEYQDTLEQKVDKRTEELAKSNKDLEQFAYITSHDLREPLRMITSFLQLLERRYADKLDQDANEFIGFAVDGAKRLDAMTNDLLQYSKITSEKQEFTPVNFEDVLEKALLNLKVPIEENNAVITHDPLPIINGDEQLEIQLFQNLIGNSVKYHGQEPPKIHISAAKEKNQYLFSIKDNGIGMSPEHLKKIFIIFRRLHTHEEYEGTGIGLAIAQKIVQQQGGEIWAESEQGKGSTFYFTIPFMS